MLTFNKTFADSVYVEFANSELSDYTLTSSRFMVKTADEFGKPSKIVSMMVPRNTEVNFKAGISGASVDNPSKIMVDFGNGEPKEFDVTSDEATTYNIRYINSLQHVYIYA